MLKHDSLPILTVFLWRHLSRRRKYQLIFLLFIIIFSSISELISISLVIPFLGFLTNPDYLLSNSRFVKFANLLNLNTYSELVTALFAGFIGIIIISGLIKSLNYWLNFQLSAAIGSDLSSKAFRRTLNQDYMIHINRNTSKLLSSLVTDIGRIIGLTLNPTLNLISSLIVFLSLILGLVFVNPVIAITVGSLVIMFYFITFQFTKSKIKRMSIKQVELDQKLFKTLQEGMGAIRDILINSNQEVYIKNYFKIDKQLRKSYAATSFLGIMPKLIIEPFLIILLFLVGFFLINDKGVINAVPILGAVALISQKLLPLIQMIYQSITQCKTGKESLKNIISLIEQSTFETSKLKIHPLEFSYSIKISNVSFSYSKNSNLIFKNLNFEIYRGERVGIIGSTGSGKSTLTDIIMGLIEPTSGKILVDGKNLFNKKSKKLLYGWRKNIASVPQSIYLADCSIAENIAFGIPKELVDFERVKICARQAKLSEFLNKNPLGIFTLVGERGVKLSGGQRQRIGIARALYKKAEILILDESTSALDIYTEKRLMNTINNLSKNLTIIIISHRYSILENCDKILKLEGGEIKDVKLDKFNGEKIDE